MHTYCKLLFKNIDSDNQEILIAQLLELGFESFEQTHTTFSAYIPQQDFDEHLLQTVINQPYETETILPQNWNQEWEKSFEPVIVEDFCCIRASFHPPDTNTTHDIIITPKMSFGTGHHASTWLMVKMMQALDLRDKEILDFGTGTGVLAILAEKCGASLITAIDNDDWSIENAKENIRANKCVKISLHQTDMLQEQETVDLILANINKHVITRHFDSIIQHLRNEGVLILSGLLTADLTDITILINQHPLEVIEVMSENDWIAISCKKAERN